MGQINLLPKDLTPKESFIKLANALKKVSTIGFIALTILSLALIGGFLVLSRQLQSSLDNQSNLKSKIQALETTEQRLVIIKDRLSKIDHLLTSPTSSEEVEGLEELIVLFPEGVSLSNAKLTPSETFVSVSAGSSKALAQFFASLLGSDTYQRVNLNSLSFNYLSGYAIQLTLAN